MNRLAQDLLDAVAAVPFDEWTTVSQTTRKERSAKVSKVKFDAHEKALKEILDFVKKPKTARQVVEKFKITSSCANKRLEVLRVDRGLITRGQKSPYLYWVINTKQE